MTPPENQTSITEIQDYFNRNPRPTNTAGSIDGRSVNERNALFGLNLENLGVENIGLWIQYNSESEKNYRKYESLMAEIHVKKEELKQKTLNSESERKLRERNARLAFYFSAIWALFIAVFIVLHGVKKMYINILPFIEFEFTISETEFIFVCGTLTASVLIFYLTVIKNLFPNKPDASSRNNIEKKSE
ncbi:hypothetical protein [Chryseobacterium lathyri]|uniref:Uncharacterized protein n=1 Tax=Chryseobacterium lathyri TaxID=395933 RepID=A0ABT9STU8_9FLAO|nr:hypothetical protein [Chryseobacterium lathyri]MDP9961860.1 hypothetical protein [Chryseobacterium lathyri]